MAASGALRDRKPESVQFWLAIAAVSLLFHALLIVGIKRWTTVAVVEPDGGPISVELVDPAGSESVEAPIVQAAALKPEAKLEVRPEAKSEVQPEPEPEIKPEPIVQPEVKAEVKKPAIASQPKRKPETGRQPKREMTPQTNLGRRSESNNKQQGTPENVDKPALGGGKDLSGEVGTIGQKTVGITQLSLKQNDTAGADDRKATLRFKPFPATTQLSANFIRDVGPTIIVPVTFIVSCTESQGFVCLPSHIKLENQSSRFPPNLSVEYDQELEKVIDNWIQTLEPESLVYQADPLGTTDMHGKPRTYWTIEIQLQGKN